jgi:DNA-binding HxlR family transcriptional regulator
MKPAEMNMMKQSHAMCPRYEHAIQLLGKRWTGLILDALLQGPQRFCEMTAAVDGLSDRVLSDRLRELELEGIIERIVYPQIPVRVEYRLTEKGSNLQPVIEAIHHWAEEWIDLSAPKPVACSAMNANALENCAEAGADELAQ